MGLRRAMLLLTLSLSPACYRWVPHEGTLPAGTEIRVRVTDTGSDDLRRRYGANEGFVSGPLAIWSEDEVAVLAQTLLTRPGFPSTTVTDTVEVPARYVAGIDVKELDGKNTAFFTAGILAGGVGLVLATRWLGGSSEANEGDIPPPEEAIIVRIPLRIGW